MKKTTIAIIPLVLFVLLISASAMLTQENSSPRPLGTLFAPSTPIVISDSISPSSSPLIGLDANGAAHVVWIEYGDFRRFMYADNKDGSWIDPSAVERIIGTADWAGDPAFAVTAGGVCHLTFQDAGPTSADIFYLVNNNGWSRLINICFNGGGSGYSSCAVNPVDDTFYVVWNDETVNMWDIYLKFRSPSGTWGQIQTVPVGLGYTPDISLDARGTAHLVWSTRSGGDSAVLYSRNPNPQNSSQWTSPIMIKASTAEDYCFPMVRSDESGNAYILWKDGTRGNDEFFFRKVSSDGSLSDEANVSQTATSSQDGAIAVNAKTGNVYVAWSEGGQGIYLNANTGTWSGPTLLTTSLGPSFQPNLAVDSADVVHLVYASQTGRTSEIMYQTVGERTQPTTTTTTTTTSVLPDPMPPTDLVLDSRLDEFPNKKINTLSWHRNLLNKTIPLESYRIYRKGAGQPDSAYGFLAAVPADFFRYEDKDLQFSQSFAYAVSSLAMSGKESELSAPVTENSIFPPRNVQVRTIVNRSLSLYEKINIITWLETPMNAGVAVAEYHIYRWSVDAESSECELIATVGANVQAFSDRRVPRDQKFFYALTAVDTAGRESTRSDPGHEEF